MTVLVVTNTAADTDVPPLGLTYQLLNPPIGALVDSAGVITLTPTEFHGPGVYVIQNGGDGRWLAGTERDQQLHGHGE